MSAVDDIIRLYSSYGGAGERATSELYQELALDLYFALIDEVGDPLHVASMQYHGGITLMWGDAGRAVRIDTNPYRADDAQVSLNLYDAMQGIFGQTQRLEAFLSWMERVGGLRKGDANAIRKRLKHDGKEWRTEGADNWASDSTLYAEIDKGESRICDSTEKSVEAQSE